MVDIQEVSTGVQEPGTYHKMLDAIIQSARGDIKTILLSHYDGEYVYSKGDPKLLIRSGICTSAVFKLKVIDGEIMYSTMMLNRDGDVSFVGQTLYRLPDEDVLGVYKDLYELTYKKDESI